MLSKWSAFADVVDMGPKMKQVFIITVLSFWLSTPLTASEKVSDKLTDQRVLAEFTFTKGEDIILLPVKLRGEEHLFFFDTGTSRIVFDFQLLSPISVSIALGLEK